jgi:alkane 1-monooxygenase
MRPSWHFTSFLIPGLVAFGFWRGGGWAWFPVFFVFGVIPVVDALVGTRDGNRDAPDEERARRNFLYSVILYAHLPVQLGIVLGFAKAWAQHEAPLWVKAGWLLSSALSTGGIGITVAHELIHRKNTSERWVGKLLLMLVLYMHFAIEHVRGHHVLVATRDDPASAPKGMSVYRFIRKTVPAQWKSAWKLEVARLTKRGEGVWSFQNEMLRFLAIQMIWLTLLFVCFQRTFVLAYLALAVLSFLLLEIVNYIEHYGLERQLGQKGRWEAVTEAHSWNSNHRLSRSMLFELSRHSDHHRAAGRPYQVLRSEPTSPQMPGGYPAMVLLALLYPLWFHVMDPRVPQRH